MIVEGRKGRKEAKKREEEASPLDNTPEPDKIRLEGKH